MQDFEQWDDFGMSTMPGVPDAYPAADAERRETNRATHPVSTGPRYTPRAFPATDANTPRVSSPADLFAHV